MAGRGTHVTDGAEKNRSASRFVTPSELAAPQYVAAPPYLISSWSGLLETPVPTKFPSFLFLFAQLIGSLAVLLKFAYCHSK